MARTPMTPERFQQRDVKRRITKLEKDQEYRRIDWRRLVLKIRDLERTIVVIERALTILREYFPAEEE